MAVRLRAEDCSESGGFLGDMAFETGLAELMIAVEDAVELPRLKTYLTLLHFCKRLLRGD